MIFAIVDVEACRNADLQLHRAIARAENLGVDVLVVRTRTADVAVTKTVAAVPRNGTGARLINAPAALRDLSVYDGVHLRADNPLPSPRPPVLGASVHQGDVVAGRGLDYALFAPVFGARSKTGVVPVGLAALERAVRDADCAVVALGGIEPAHIEAIAQTGAVGVAALSPFCSADDRAARDLVARVRDVRWTAGPKPDRLRHLLGIA